jgi:uncharacterized integral membrane protein
MLINPSRAPEVRRVCSGQVRLSKREGEMWSWIDWRIILNVIIAILIVEAAEALGQLWARWVRRSFFPGDPTSSDNESS